MFRLMVPGIVGLVLFLFWIYCIFDVISTDESAVRNLPKTGWLFAVIFLFDIGALAWIILGRPQNVSLAPGGVQPSPAVRRKTGATAPDDDPDFLRHLEERRRLSNWEEQLKRREDDLRRRAEGDDPPGEAR